MTISNSETEEGTATTDYAASPDERAIGPDTVPHTVKAKKPSKPRPGKGPPPKQYLGRTFLDIVQYHPRTEPERQGIPGFTVRELCSTLHVAAESLRTAYEEPGRLTLTGLMALAEKMDEDPLRVAADLFSEIRFKKKESEKPKPKSVKRARLNKKKPAAQSDDASEAQQGAPDPAAE